MRTKRTFRPIGDCLESRDVPASFGVASRIVQFHQASVASRLSTPFAGTMRLSVAPVGQHLSSTRTATPRAGTFGLNTLGLNGLTNTNLGFNLGGTSPSNLTINQLRSVINQLAAGSPLGNSGTLLALLRANVNNPNLTPVLGNNPSLINTIRTNINNPNLPSVLSRMSSTSLLNNGLNFPATLGTTNTGAGFGTGLNGLLGSQLGNTSMLSTGTQGFVSFQ